MDGQRWGLPRGARSGNGGGKKEPRRDGIVRLLFGRGRVRQGGGGRRGTGPTHGGSGTRARGGVPLTTGGRRPASSGPRLAGVGDVRRVHTTGQTEGERRG
jgi:hypothetical protein